MVETTFNMFDLIVLAVVGFSALLSFFRGFIREVLSLGAWVAASIVTLYAFPDVAKMVAPHVKSDVIASGFAAMGTFIVALLSFSIVNSLLMKILKQGKDVGMLDNLLGMGFGMFRGGLLVSLGFLILTLLIPETDYPEWLEAAKTRPYVEKGAELLAKVAPSYLEELSGDVENMKAEGDVNMPSRSFDLPNIVRGGENASKSAGEKIEEGQNALDSFIDEIKQDQNVDVR